MSDEARQRLIVERERLRGDFRRLRHSLTDYRAFLADAPETAGGDGWLAGATDLLRAQRLELLRTRVSLGVGELATALLREVLRRLSIDELRFRSRAPRAGDNGHGGAAPAEPPGPGGPAQEPELAGLLASLRVAAQTAPLELQEPLQRVLAEVGEFFAALAQGQAERLEAAVTRINLATSNPQSRSLLREIAIVTRDVYNTLKSVSAELPLDGLSESSSGISEAVQRLNTVMRRLDEAASQNLDHLERVNRIASEEAQALGGVVRTLRTAQKRLMLLKQAHPELDGALTEIQARLSDEVGAPAMTLRHQLGRAGDHHMELISNQSFQELTGRTLKKIIDFVQSLEADLVALLGQYRPRGATVPAPGEAAPATAGGRQQTQSDVDQLLGELGF
jgi:chemotaxis protein CheZ